MDFQQYRCGMRCSPDQAIRVRALVGILARVLSLSWCFSLPRCTKEPARIKAVLHGTMCNVDFSRNNFARKIGHRVT